MDLVTIFISGPVPRRPGARRRTRYRLPHGTLLWIHTRTYECGKLLADHSSPRPPRSGPPPPTHPGLGERGSPARPGVRHRAVCWRGNRFVVAGGPPRPPPWPRGAAPGPGAPARCRPVARGCCAPRRGRCRAGRPGAAGRGRAPAGRRPAAAIYTRGRRGGGSHPRSGQAQPAEGARDT